MTAVTPPLVVHVIHRLDYGGLENGVVNLVNGIPNTRLRQAIVCLSGYNPAFRRRILEPQFPVVSLDKRPGKDPAVYGRMYDLLRVLRPQVLHTRNLGTIDMQWVGWARRVPVRIHGEHGWEASDPRGEARRPLWIRRACRPVIHRFVPMSADGARWLRDSVGIPVEAIHQVYSGVDLRKFHPASEKPKIPGRPDALDPGEIVIGTVGRLDPVKNQEMLLRAFELVLRRRPALRNRLRLVVVGDGPLLAHLTEIARSLCIADRSWFAGRRDDTADLLRLLDIFVLTSLNEGISNTILEAMASGLPVVATRVGGSVELIRDQVTGSLTEPESHEALAEALLTYVDDPQLRAARGSRARARVEADFSLDKMIERYADLYESMLRPPRPSNGP